MHMYLFLLNPNSDHCIQSSRGYMLQNCSAYDHVTRVVPASRLAILGRANPCAVFGLPDLPETYSTLDVEADPPVFQDKGWEIFHKNLKTDLFNHLHGN